MLHKIRRFKASNVLGTHRQVKWHGILGKAYEKVTLHLQESYCYLCRLDFKGTATRCSHIKETEPIVRTYRTVRRDVSKCHNYRFGFLVFFPQMKENDGVCVGASLTEHSFRLSNIYEEIMLRFFINTF